jgi:DNA-binding NtrC family response regulator
MLVLVVEEETHERDAIVEHLEQAGFAVRQAADTDEAWTTLERESAIDALVTDAHVPGALDGEALAVQALERWPQLAVVLISGHSDAAAGPVPAGTAFVSKPFLFENLVPALTRRSGRGAA